MSKASPDDRSLDQIEAAQFRAGPRPMDAAPRLVVLTEGEPVAPVASHDLSLNGEWLMAEGGALRDRVGGKFSDAVFALVPGSVHAALEKAGRIPDQRVGKNDALARAESFKDWWFCKRFSRPAFRAPRLVFEGVANKFGVFLNGKYLGDHGGMFGSWEVPLENLADENLLVVRVLPAPYQAAPDDYFPGANLGWQQTVTINNVYGWHYANIPCLGIWRPVRIVETPEVRMGAPFFALFDRERGVVDFALELHGSVPGEGQLSVHIEPENFSGPAYVVQESVPLNGTVRLRFSLPGARLWWPNGAGGQALYRSVVFLRWKGETIAQHVTFGLRTVEMAPLPSGAASDRYDWTFVINGRPMFVKGTGWCTMDSALDFSRARYERFLGLARDQHCQMVRAWGSGMPETDDFYECCDRMGLMVMQEWPTAWNSQKLQPYQQLEETVRQNTLRLRNRPSLVMWGGGNESLDVEDPIIDMMGRHAIELDGTRPFHRGEPRGGSQHNYDCWWGMKPLDHNVTMEAPFWGEFGIASTPAEESVLRYLPKEEQQTWPPAEDGAFAHHTPVFNSLDDLKRLRFYAESFARGETLAEFVRASQVAQATALRHTLERSRVRWPHCTGALYYKLNDNYPAVSWSTVDWYGAPKIAHYFCQDAFSPVHACVLIPKLDVFGEAVALPVFLLDDHNALADQDWTVRVRAFNGRLDMIREETFSGRGSRTVQEVGRLLLAAPETQTVPLLLVVEWNAAERKGRSFSWLNYEKKQGALFALPKTELHLEVGDRSAVLTNTGSLPAVGAHVLRPGYAETFRISDNYFWLDAGESVSLEVRETGGLWPSAWNV